MTSTKLRGQSLGFLLFLLTGCSDATIAIPASLRLLLSTSTNVLVRGASLTLSAALQDGNGQPVNNVRITFESRDSAVMAVSDAGVVTGVKPGATWVVARATTVADSLHLQVTEIPAPEPGVGDVIIWQDNFDKSSQAGLTAPYATRGSVQLVASGRSGGAARFAYTAANPDNLIEKSWAPTKSIYVRYWYRTSPGADPTCGNQGPSGMKWFMAWRPDPLPRYTFGVGNLDLVTFLPPNTGLEFGMHDNSSPDMANGFPQNISRTPKFGTTNNGSWHEYTIHIVTDRGDGSGTGYEQIWIDGVLTNDDSAYNWHHETTGISLIQFPGLVVNWFSGCDFTIDIDDLAVWHK